MAGLCQAADSLTVTRVIDGYTLQLSDGETVRLIGVDTPESADSAKRQPDANRTGQDAETIIRMGKEAAEFTRRLVAPGQSGATSPAAETKSPNAVTVVVGKPYDPALISALPGSPSVGKNDQKTAPNIEDKPVRLEYDVQKKDPYGRTLAYVYLDDGTFVNAVIIKAGYARVMASPPNVKYQELFVKLEKDARDQKRGLWG